MHSAAQLQHERHNVLLLLADFVLFGAAFGFFSASTVLPEFLRHLTESSLLIGLMSSLQMGAWTLPQIIAAGYVTGRPLKRPYLIWPAALGRPSILLLALLTYLFGASQPGLVLAATYVCLGVFMFTDALAAVPWFDLVAKMVPATRRGRLFGAGQVGGSLAAIAVASVVRQVLGPGGLPFPHSYALLFLCGGLLTLISLLTYPFLREEPSEDAGQRLPWRALLPKAGAILARDRHFLRLTAARLTAGLGGMSTPFYVLFATGPLGIDSRNLGSFIAAQTIGGITAGIVLNYINEKRGSRAVIRLATGLATLIPLGALGIALLHARGGSISALAYSVVFLLLGISFSSGMPGYFAYLMELAPEADRPTYLALSNTLSGASITAPLLGGWLLDHTSYPLLFGLTAVGLAISLTLTLGLTEPRQATHAANATPI